MSADNVVRHVLDDGTIHYRNAAGELHRKDGPAVVYPNGGEEWHQNGKRHRKDGPAVVYPEGTKEWYLNGVLHRADGPAIVYPGGTKKWYLNGVCHREDGPAVVRPDGSKKWYLNGVFHRKDGPAVMYPDGSEQWYLNGVLHREDGPAVVVPDGTNEWFQHGKLHCIDGPAVVDLTGNCEYWIDGTFILSKTIGDVYYLKQEGYEVYKDRLSPELVVKVMSDKGFVSVEEFGSWLAFVVLGEEAVPVFARANEEGTTVLPVLDEYLRNHEDYAGLPFSWWYPIVENESRQQ